MLHLLETDVLNDGGVDPKEAEHRKYTKAADINKCICIIKLNIYACTFSTQLGRV